jgi:hypothetical protein
MVALNKLCLFTRTRLLIMLLSATFFTFIFPFKAQQCCAWIVLRTNNMYCLTLLRLLDVCKWIFVYILLLVIDTCCVKGWKVAHRIFARKEDEFIGSIVFIFHVVCLGLRCYVIFHCILVLYLFISCLLFGFLFFLWINIFFATIHLYHVHFSHRWICMVFLFVIVFLFFIWSFPLPWFRFLIFLFFWTFFCNNPLFLESG